MAVAGQVGSPSLFSSPRAGEMEEYLRGKGWSEGMRGQQWAQWGPVEVWQARSGQWGSIQGRQELGTVSAALTAPSCPQSGPPPLLLRAGEHGWHGTNLAPSHTPAYQVFRTKISPNSREFFPPAPCMTSVSPLF